MHDDISKAFADISPEDFFRQTSAIDDTILDAPAVGQPAFDEWTDGMVSITYRRANEHAEFNPFAVLGNDTRRRIFLADGDETPEHWASRLRREAQDMKATWFYVALLSPGRTYDDERPDPIQRTEEAIDAAINEGLLIVGVCWLAMRDDAEGLSNRSGIFTFDDTGKIDGQFEGEIDAEDNPFTSVLGSKHAL